MKAKSSKKAKSRPGKPCSWSLVCKNAAPVVIEEGVERYCKKHARVVADLTVGTWVKRFRDLRCRYCGTDQDLEWAHIRSRGAHPALHWYVGPEPDNPGNSTTLCRGHHFAFTNHQARWEVFVEEQWPGLYGDLIALEIELKGKAPEPDLAAIIRNFRGRQAA